MSQVDRIISASISLPDTVMLPEREYQLLRNMLAHSMLEVLENSRGSKIFFSPIKEDRFRRFNETEFRVSVEWGFIETVRLTTADLPQYPKMGFWRRLRFLFTGQ